MTGLAALDARSAEIYRVEPYVVAADVYAARDKMGRGGWTWYTGSAGWMYRAAVEGLLGIRRRPGGIEIDPSLPDDWPGFTVRLSRNGVTHEIVVGREDGQTSVTLDGQRITEGGVIALPDLIEGSARI